MKVVVKLARVGMNMQEATVVEWFKKPGEAFLKGDPLYAIETEKVTQEVTATADGTLLEAFVAEGDEVAVGAPVCSVDLKPSAV